MAGGSWLPQQLAELLAAVSSFPDEESAVRGALERAAEAVEAEVAAVVVDGSVVTSLGYPAGRVDVDGLLAVASGSLTELDVRGVGACACLTVPLDVGARASMVFARSGDSFDQLEQSLLRAVARVVSLVQQMLRSIQAERQARVRSDVQAQENARLVGELRDRQALLERLFKIQRSISHRDPTQNVLDAITEGAVALLGDAVAGLRLVDENEPSYAVMVSMTGVGSELQAGLRRTLISEGVGGLAIARGDLVVADHYQATEHAMGAFVSAGVQAAMAAPVFRNGKVVGSLAVASYDGGRRYSLAEQDVLRALAEHASLALNDASAVEAMKRAFDDALHQATHDSLTGLPNRAVVLERLAHALGNTNAADGQVSVLFVDLDRFKNINDSLGHSVGDEVLVQVSQRLNEAVRPGDLVGRLAGDEFVVVCERLSPEAAMAVAERVCASMNAPITLYGREAVISASIGIAFSSAGGSAEDMLRDADVAMYRAKERGRARVEVFDRVMRTRVLQKIETEHALRAAVPRGELRSVYQPIVSAQDGSLLALEALVRWQHPGRGLLGPDDFIRTAEESGLVLPLGRWVLNEACHDVARWRALRPDLDLRVCVNLSARQFVDPDLPATLAQAAAIAGVDPSAIVVEITESAVMEDANETTDALRQLRRLGTHIAVDDFGTGYSSLSYLKRFPIDTLKIDRSFVDGLGNDAEDEAIVGAIVGMARALDLTVVAEGVETERQLEMVRALGCNAVQGYLVGVPQPADDIDELILTRGRVGVSPLAAGAPASPAKIVGRVRTARG